jgi:hypothetical protein
MIWCVSTTSGGRDQGTVSSVGTAEGMAETVAVVRSGMGVSVICGVLVDVPLQDASKVVSRTTMQRKLAFDFIGFLLWLIRFQPIRCAIAFGGPAGAARNGIVMNLPENHSISASRPFKDFDNDVRIILPNRSGSCGALG